MRTATPITQFQHLVGTGEKRFGATDRRPLSLGLRRAEEPIMLGAIAGVVIGSVHERAATKTKDFPLFVARSTFTDDSVLTVAVADWILTGQNLVDLLHTYTHAYPGRGYGGLFCQWARNRVREPYNSFGDGAALRVSPVGFAFETVEEVLARSERWKLGEEPATSSNEVLSAFSLCQTTVHLRSTG